MTDNQQQKRKISTCNAYELILKDTTTGHIDVHKFFENKKSLLHYLTEEKNIIIPWMSLHRIAQTGNPSKKYPHIMVIPHQNLIKEQRMKAMRNKRCIDGLPYGKMESTPYKLRGWHSK